MRRAARQMVNFGQINNLLSSFSRASVEGFYCLWCSDQHLEWHIQRCGNPEVMFHRSNFLLSQWPATYFDQRLGVLPPFERYCCSAHQFTPKNLLLPPPHPSRRLAGNVHGIWPHAPWVHFSCSSADYSARTWRVYDKERILGYSHRCKVKLASIFLLLSSVSRDKGIRLFLFFEYWKDFPIKSA